MGMRGMHRMNGKTQQVQAQKDCAADRARSIRLWLLSIVVTLVLTGFAFLVPHP